MTISDQHPVSGTPRLASGTRFLLRCMPLFVFLATGTLYAATAAPATLFGDPSEYQFIPAILGIAHPPGYAFYTVLARLWQMLVPLGTIAFRTNLLAAAVGAWAVTAVYLIVRDFQSANQQIGKSANQQIGKSANRQISTLHSSFSILRSPFSIRYSPLVPLFAAFSLAVAPDLWQHAIHANAHVVSAALAATHLWLLVRWWRTGRERWLFAFAVALGLAATHHPITLMGVPAYGLFILAARPSILRQWRTILVLVGCLLAGLAPLLYYPLRSPSVPFGPTDMRTWEGFWRHATAQGLRVNLFHFGLADQPDRAVVLWSLLRLQFPLPVIALIVVGLVRLVRRTPRPALLIYAFLATHLFFTLNTIQDVMAYLLLPFVALAVTAGVGALALAEWMAKGEWRMEGGGWRMENGEWRVENGERRFAICRFADLPICYLPICYLLFAICCLLPFYQAALNLQRGISLRGFTAAEEYVEAVYGRFAGHGERAVLLSDWEHLTPLWVHIYTQGEKLGEADVKLVYVSTSNPWVESVWQHVEEGPIYLPDYRPAVREAGLRLVPEGRFYRVVAPPVTGATPAHALDVWADRRVHILGYDLPTDTVRAGEFLELALYQRVPEPLEGIWMPYAQLGPVEARWTTDSRLLTPQWLPGEVVVERYEVPVPFTLPAGAYPLRLGYADLSGGRAELALSTGGVTVDLATVTVLPGAAVPPARVLERALANLDNQVALMGARARAGWQVRQAPWEKPLAMRAGAPLHLTLTWRALASPRDSATVFIHLLDGAGRYVIGHDYPPLGGACPTVLWFPKWLAGQTLTDPYRLALPADLSPGDYWLEVGMYGMTSLRRLPVVDLEGNLAGDRIVLGPVRVE